MALQQKLRLDGVCLILVWFSCAANSIICLKDYRESAESCAYATAAIGLIVLVLIIWKRCKVLYAQGNIRLAKFFEDFILKKLCEATLYSYVIIALNLAIYALFADCAHDSWRLLGSVVTSVIGMALSVCLPLFPRKAKYFIAMIIYMLLSYITSIFIYTKI